ncbi:MAG: hypothetical protein U0793_04040 [Gemmataceae bacterium]
MNGALGTLSLPHVSAEVEEFALAKDITRYLSPVIELARRAFPASTLCVSLARDAEDDAHRYIALDIDAASLSDENLLAGQRLWSAGITRVCPSSHAVYFVLGWQ